MTTTRRGCARRSLTLTVALSASLALAACGGTGEAGSPSGANDTAGASGPDVRTSDGKTTLRNCGQDVTYDTPVTRLFANDGNIISIALAAGARPELVAVSSLERDRAVLNLKFPGQLDGLNVVNAKYPTLENIIAAQPQLVFAGWNYGFSEERNLTPDSLSSHGIESYLLSESCRSEGTTRGIMDPWQAVTTDITAIGALTGHQDEAAASVADIERRKEALEKLAKPQKPPVVFLFDSAQDAILSSGSFGAPQAVIEAAGGTNALADVKDTWTRVSWERITTADPDLIAFVDYPPQTYADKLNLLNTNPASKDLAAVKEKRYVNLPYAMWTSGPLNVDAAEILRRALESYGLAPEAAVTPGIDLTKLSDLPGNEWLTK